MHHFAIINYQVQPAAWETSHITASLTNPKWGHSRWLLFTRSWISVKRCLFHIQPWIETEFIQVLDQQINNWGKWFLSGRKKSRGSGKEISHMNTPAITYFLISRNVVDAVIITCGNINTTNNTKGSPSRVVKLTCLVFWYKVKCCRDKIHCDQQRATN